MRYEDKQPSTSYIAVAPLSIRSTVALFCAAAFAVLVFLFELAKANSI